MRFVLCVRHLAESIGLAVECIAAIAVLSACASAQADEPATSPEMSQVMRRLDVLEAQNAELARQNASLRQSLSDQGPIAPSATYVASDAGPPDVPMELEAELEKLGGAVEELGAGMEEMKTGVEELATALRVTTLHEYSKIALFGEINGETLWSNARPFIPSAPLFLAPAPIVPGFDDDTFAISARSSLLGAGFERSRGMKTTTESLSCHHCGHKLTVAFTEDPSNSFLPMTLEPAGTFACPGCGNSLCWDVEEWFDQAAPMGMGTLKLRDA